MQLNQHLNQRQILKLTQILSPKIIQMLKTFNMSYVDLLEDIKNEVKENVFIEIVQEDALLPEYARKKYDNNFNFLGNYDVENMLDKKTKTLESFLLEQLEFLNIKDKEKQIAKIIIENLDDRGYIENFDMIKKKIIQQFNVKDRKVLDVLKIVQEFEPDGVGARSLKECLLIQLNAYNFEHEKLKQILKKIIQQHLNDLAKQNFEYIAKKFGIEIEGVRYIVKFLRENFNPNPGAGFFNTSLNEIVIPSFEVLIDDGKIVLINLEKKLGIKIKISSDYENKLLDTNLDNNTKKYLKAKYENAKQFIDILNKRVENLEKLVAYIIEKQEAFILSGPEYLEPLLQKNISEYLGVSPSTISRVVSSKYIQTPYGVFSLKALCPRSTFGKTTKRLKKMIENIIKEKPELSDERISLILKSQGISIARRTVSKYRKELGIDKKYMRLNKIMN